MIIDPRKIDTDTKDSAPQVADVVIPYRAGAEGSEGRTRVTRVLAHYPAMGPGAWEVEVVGIRKPLRRALVVQAADREWPIADVADGVGVWRELGGR